MATIAWGAGEWTTAPVSTTNNGTTLSVECALGSDFWRTTFYGFERDSGHALLVPFRRGQACEVTFKADFQYQYDQAGLMIRQSENLWLKAGIEYSDGRPQLGAVVTRGESDWSCAAVPEWAGRHVTVRASWMGDAILVRARTAGEPWRMVRVAPFAGAAPARAGLYCAAPERSGLAVTFTRLSIGEADTQLHLE